ncbi:MAG: ribosome silencing factor [Spirochaetes bacterium RBG_13_51_14]|nr:MAG: ribosome silencing factor [Spirochaetes bacterium RBG_13_51_14]
MTDRLKVEEQEIVDISRECAQVLSEKKGLDIVIMDLRCVNSYLDYFLIATGNSRIHCRSMARDAEKFIHSKGLRQRNKPDYESGWIILDFNELIVHIFTHELREYYQLERLWGDATEITY